MTSQAERHEIATRKGLYPNAGGTVAAHQCARARRNFFLHIIPSMKDKEVLQEADYLAMWIRMIGQGTPTAYRIVELQARLRALHREAAKRRLTIPWDRTTGVRK